MQVTITARHFELTEALKTHAKDGIRTLKKYSDNIIFAEVVLWKEKNRHFAEMNLKVNKLNVFSKTKEDDMYKAIDEALNKAERQIKKHFEKLHEHHTKKYNSIKEIPQEIAPLSRNINKKEIVLNDMDVENAIQKLDKSYDDFILFRNKEDNKINLLQKNDQSYEVLELK